MLFERDEFVWKIKPFEFGLRFCDFNFFIIKSLYLVGSSVGELKISALLVYDFFNSASFPDNLSKLVAWGSFAMWLATKSDKIPPSM